MNYIEKLKHLECQETATSPTHKPSHIEWLMSWRELATLTSGITQDDPRLQPIMEALNACDTAYIANDWAAFQQAGLTVRQRVEGR